MKYLALLAALAVALAMGCSDDKDDAKMQAATHARMKGHVVVIADGYAWLSRGTADTVFLADSTNGRLAEVVQNFSLSPNMPVYAEILASQASDQFTIYEILRAVPADMATSIRDVDSLVFLASGNEPFWAIELTADSLIFKSPEEERRLALTDRGAVADSLWLFQATGTDDASSVMVQIIRNPCYDSMSGAYSAFSATVLLWQQQLTGCAVQGLIVIPIEPEIGMTE